MKRAVFGIAAFMMASGLIVTTLRAQTKTNCTTDFLGVHCTTTQAPDGDWGTALGTLMRQGIEEQRRKAQEAARLQQQEAQQAQQEELRGQQEAQEAQETARAEAARQAEHRQQADSQVFMQSVGVAIRDGRCKDAKNIALAAGNIDLAEQVTRICRPIIVKKYGKVSNQSISRLQVSPQEPAEQFRRGNIYYFGSGLLKDYTEALKWYRKAAAQGYAQAQYNVGVMYEHGQGVSGDAAQAAVWFRKAAEQGYAPAQHNLAHMYDEGDGMKKDGTQAVIWYRKAADQGYALSQYNLGVHYFDGQDIPKNYLKAYIWLSKSSSAVESSMEKWGTDPDAHKKVSDYAKLYIDTIIPLLNSRQLSAVSGLSEK